MLRPSILCVFAGITGAAASGPYPPGPSDPGSDAIPAASALFQAWATGSTAFQPGKQQAGQSTSPAAYGSPASITGAPDAAGFGYPNFNNNSPPASGPVLSLGDGGRITLTFARAIADGEGPDFAVFENGFATSGTQIFAELAFVEVSSDGVNFTRFPAVSATQTTTQTVTFGTLDPTCLHNLAGKHPAGYGTPFDLAELTPGPELNLQRISHVRLTDVVGDVKTGLGSLDSTGSWINDPFPTNFASGGFDLDAVGVIHVAPDPWQAWINASFDEASAADPLLTAADADPDHDGRSNLMEYATGSLPMDPDAAPALEITADAATASLRYRRAAGTDATLVLQQSRNAQPWEPVVSGNGVTLVEDGPLVIVSLPLTPSAMFRLKAVRSP